jgi:hypothetical protein
MLTRVTVPPFALQLGFLAFGFALSTYSDWLDERFVANLSNRSGRDIGETAVIFWFLGIIGILVFLPLHWLALLGARAFRTSAARLHLVVAVVVAVLVAPLFLIKADLAIVLSLLAPCLAIMGLMTWAVDAWHRRRELREQQVTDAFVHLRKQKLHKFKKS